MIGPGRGSGTPGPRDLRFRAARPADRAAWDAFLAGRPEADTLQAWVWGDVSATARERPVRVLAEDPTGRIRAVAQALARPAILGRQVLYVAHGPVWEREADDAPVLLRRLVGALHAMARHERGLVVKLDPRATAEWPAAPLDAVLAGEGLRPARHDLQARTTRLVDLAAPEGPLGGWSGSARKELRRAERRGVTVRVDRSGSADAIEDLHQLLAERAARRGFRPRPVAFLRDLARGCAATDGWFLALAYAEGRAIAAHSAPRLGDRAFGFYGGSLRDPDVASLFGSTAAMGALLEALAADGVRWYDLWGVVEEGDTDADPDWQRFSAYKRKFGGIPLRHPGTYDLVVQPLLYRVRDARERLRDRRSG